jgi:2-polyprenyl-3-methyl-5-hydroxy-6-metoxy-1,4-benzoquinol methylase
LTSPHHEEYRYQETIFRKEYLPNGEVVFLKNNQPLTLAEWNREVNALHPQSLKANNRNIIIRWLEQQRRRSFLKFVNAQPTDHIADIGCETGFMVHALAPKTAKVVGIDIDEAMLELAREAAHHPNV